MTSNYRYVNSWFKQDADSNLYQLAVSNFDFICILVNENVGMVAAHNIIEELNHKHHVLITVAKPDNSNLVLKTSGYALHTDIDLYQSKKRLQELHNCGKLTDVINVLVECL